jgi:hypothetical protein
MATLRRERNEAWEILSSFSGYMPDNNWKVIFLRKK